MDFSPGTPRRRRPYVYLLYYTILSLSCKRGQDQAFCREGRCIVGRAGSRAAAWRSGAEGAVMAEVAAAGQRGPFVAELEAKNLHPLWDRYQRITPVKPAPKDTP